MLNFNWAAGIGDFGARVLIIAAFIVPLVFALSMKKAYIMKGSSDKKRWRDLRIWILMLVVIQSLIYAYF